MSARHRDHAETDERAAQPPVLAFARPGPFLGGDPFGVDEVRRTRPGTRLSSGVSESVRSTHEFADHRESRAAIEICVVAAARLPEAGRARQRA